MKLRPVLLGLAAGLAVIAMAIAGGLLSLFAPAYLDDRAVDRIVAVVVLDWRDFGQDVARERLLIELDKGQIGSWVGDDSCTLTEQAGTRRVSCSWSAVVTIPFGEWKVPLHFSSQATLGTDGRVH